MPAIVAGFFACTSCRRAFDEVLTDTTGHDAKFSGYFAGVAMRGDSGWALRTAHWSLVHPNSP